MRAMVSGVTGVRLYDGVTMDMETLAEYSGQGRCRRVQLSRSIAAKYWEDLRTWARGRNWRIDSINRMNWRIEVDEDEDLTYIPDWDVISDPVSENI